MFGDTLTALLEEARSPDLFWLGRFVGALTIAAEEAIRQGLTIEQATGRLAFVMDALGGDDHAG